jgi:protein SCO1/2
MLSRYFRPSNEQMLIRAITICAVALCALCAPHSTFATERPELVESEAAIVEHLDGQIDLSLEFNDQNGSRVALKDLFVKNKPLVIVPVYYACPRLCGLTLAGLKTALNETHYDLGKDYQLVVFSFDDSETPEQAMKRHAEFVKGYRKPSGAEASSFFLTGSVENIKTLMTQLGFRATPDGKEFIHAAAVMILSPAGKISRYFYGIKFPGAEFARALLDASQGKIGSSLEKIFFYCFRFDPTRGKYTLAVMNVTRVILLGIFFVLASTLAFLRLKERQR